MRVALLATGKTELLGLPDALTRLFPGHSFDAVWELPGQRPYWSFTSNRLPSPPAPAPPALDKLVEEAAARVDPRFPGRDDFVVLLDDLELVNQDQPHVVIQSLRDAVDRHIMNRYSKDPIRNEEIRTALASRVSFHLAAPMIESWFFADPNGYFRAGVTRTARISIRDGDQEQFESTDPNYLNANECDCPQWLKNKKKRIDRPKWLGDHSRAKHPKGYLQWLMKDGSSKRCTSYDEVNNGAEALRQIDWAELLKYRKRNTYARALIADLSDALGQAPTIPNWQGDEADLTSRLTLRASHYLRNI